MNKEDFTYVLQSTLWSNEGIGLEEMKEEYGIPEALAKMGIKIANKLNTIQEVTNITK